MVSLARYLLRQHLAPLGLAFGIIVFVLVIDVVLQMLDQVLSKGLTATVALQLFVFNLAWIIALAVPMAVLVAVLMAFGRLAADNELLAMKAAGIGFGRVVAPVLIAAALLSVAMVWFNDRVLPDWNHRARELSSSLKRQKAALVLKQKEGVFLRDLGPYHLLIRDVDEATNQLRDLTLYDTGRSGPPTTLRADAGRIEIFGEGGYVRLTLEDGEINRVDADDARRFSRGRFAHQILHIRDARRDFTTYRSTYRSDREMDVSLMWASVRAARHENERVEVSLDSMAAAFVDSAAVATDLDALSRQGAQLATRIDKQHRLMKTRDRRAASYLVEIHKKFSIAVACIVFVLVGAPLGAMTRTRGTAVAVAVSLGFFFTYWSFLIGGEELADRGFLHPALAMWSANLVFGVVGLLLLRAASLDRGLPGLLDRLRRPRARTSL